jgi:predicted lipoprotein with Yx(FWY)xxD motif
MAGPAAGLAAGRLRAKIRSARSAVWTPSGTIVPSRWEITYMNALTWPRRITGALAVAALVAACSSGATPVPTAAPQASSAAAGSGSVLTVAVHQDPAMGAWLTGQDGKSLYMLTKDSSGKSTCTGACTANWPPFTLSAGESVVAGAGVTGTLSTIKRDDGTDQVAINGLPLYYFKGDSGAAQSNGEGFGGVWFLASPTGTTVGAAASPAASPAGSGSKGYGY